MKYEIWIKTHGCVCMVKEYPFKLQAYIWCWLNGYVMTMGGYGYFLNSEVEIKEVNNDR